MIMLCVCIHLMYNSLILLKYWYNLQQAGRRTYASVVKSSRTTQQQAGDNYHNATVSNSTQTRKLIPYLGDLLLKGILLRF